MKKKIAVLTQPLHDNYGGLLQAYALKETLQSLGHEVVIINRRVKHSSKFRIFASVLKKIISGKKRNPKLKLTQYQKKIISQNTLAFREKYLPNLSHLITSNQEMKSLNKMGFDAYIVGSDQSWRPRYSPAIRNYFLDFVQEKQDITRITYAVSFGVDNWEFNETDTKVCANLAQKFNAISVREDSGIKLVKEYLGMHAVHLVDPTMLLCNNHYKNIIVKENVHKSEGNLKVYVLDKTKEKQKIINDVEEKLGLKQFQIMPNNRLQNDKIENIEDFVYPSPIKWLKGYQDAEFVIADSFHGTVFAILFNIPFLTLGNEQRGMARFESLLKMFGLENRLITDIHNTNIDDILKLKIDWDLVNKKLQSEKEKSISFLKSNL